MRRDDGSTTAPAIYVRGKDEKTVSDDGGLRRPEVGDMEYLGAEERSSSAMGGAGTGVPCALMQPGGRKREKTCRRGCGLADGLGFAFQSEKQPGVNTWKTPWVKDLRPVVILAPRPDARDGIRLRYFFYREERGAESGKKRKSGLHESGKRIGGGAGADVKYARYVT